MWGGDDTSSCINRLQALRLFLYTVKKYLSFCDVKQKILINLLVK